MIKPPTRQRLLELLCFNPESGALYWAKTIGSRATAGGIAGSLTSQGYRVVRVDGELWRAHHLAWMLHHGDWPTNIVIHINGDKADNRIANLKIGTKREAHAHTRAAPITKHNVHDIFDYDDGTLRWKDSLSGKSRIRGAAAGYVNGDGYIVVETGGKAVAAHRIVWLMHHGVWPQGEIDHLNGVRNDNKIENLRDVERLTNTENRRSASRHSRSGWLGVEQLKSGQFRARIRSRGTLHELGIFSSGEDAHSAYVEAKRRIHAGNTL